MSKVLSHDFVSSILDHSCQPNCVVSFSGPAVTVTTFTGISSLEEARISYLDPKLPTKTRQQKLLDNYYFLCGCPKCLHSHHHAAGAKCNKRNKGKR